MNCEIPDFSLLLLLEASSGLSSIVMIQSFSRPNWFTLLNFPEEAFCSCETWGTSRIVTWLSPENIVPGYNDSDRGSPRSWIKIETFILFSALLTPTCINRLIFIILG